MKSIQAALIQIKISILLLVVLTLLLGLIYPLFITALSQLFFPWQANGSVITLNDQEIGSLLIGQAFTEEKYFWSRPSATIPYPYNAAASSGSNMGPSNPTFLAQIQARVNYLQRSNSSNKGLIPTDLVTASGSGLDPDISPEAAFYQVARIAKARQLSEVDIQLLINHLIIKRSLGILGEPRVNVLQLNLALDANFRRF